MKGSPKANTPGRVGSLVLGACIVAAVAALFNFFPDKVGVVRWDSQGMHFTPLLGPGFASYLPGLNIWWGMTFFLLVARLVHGRWTVVMRWIHVAAQLFGAAALGRMALGDPFLPVGGPLPDLEWLLVLACVGLLAAAARRLQKLLVIKPIIFRWEHGERVLPSEGKGASR